MDTLITAILIKIKSFAKSLQILGFYEQNLDLANFQIGYSFQIHSKDFMK